MKHQPNLTAQHKENRFKFALEHVLWKKKWNSVIFSDEKKFNLDGPDGYKFYWHHIKMHEINYSTRVMGGGGIMVWVGFCYDEKLTIQIIDKRMNSLGYFNMLDRSLKCFLDDNKDNDYVFQQDNAPCHRAKNTIKWFAKNNVETMNWPALSPDLNPVENIWSDMSKIVYSNGRQYNSLQDLNTAILLAWALIPQENLRLYAKGMQKRMTDVLKAKGGKIDK